MPIRNRNSKKNFLPSNAGNKMKALILNTFMKESFYFSKPYYNAEGKPWALAQGDKRAVKPQKNSVCKKASLAVTFTSLGSRKMNIRLKLLKLPLEVVHILTFRQSMSGNFLYPCYPAESSK